MILKTIYQTLYFLHPQPVQIDDAFSQKVYKKYFENLDPQKNYFLQSDIEAFSYYRNRLDEAFINGDLTFFNQIIERLYEKTLQVEDLYKQLLSRPFDFGLDEVIDFDEDKRSYAKDLQSWKEQLRKYFKYLTIIEMDTPEVAKKNIVTSQSVLRAKRWAVSKEREKEKEPSVLTKKNFARLEKEARRRVEENMSEYLRRFKMREKLDCFSLYVNTITTQYDPHTNYFSPKEKENFDLNISGQLEGIGAQLQDKRGYATVVKLIVGGPAWKSKKLEVGDKIIKVAQSNAKESKNIIGMLLDNSIRLIRGKKGTKVRLTIQKKDGTMQKITLVRDLIEQEEVFAKSVIISDKGKGKYGLIYLPEFYFNPNNKGARNAATDIRQQLEILKKENIQGLIFDLRNNGGGSLEAVVDITGLFVGEGPVVQVKSSDKKKEILKYKGSKAIWEGPLIILVNELSASASEILAAAIEDYKRGLVLGARHTFGKGTVQTFYPLDRFVYPGKELGVLKFTTSKFYRINGSSTQLKGVNADVIIPSRYTYIKSGEKDQDNPLPWDSISAVPYEIWKSPVDIEKIKAKSNARIKVDRNVQLLDEIAQISEQREKEKSISLNWEKFKAEKKRRENQNKKYNHFKNYSNGLLISSPSAEIHLLKQDSLFQESKKEWYKSLTKDLYIEEAVRILRDIRQNDV
ncbi:MAG: carboxy terminal-processing peptidase [Flavobacteriales bacterium]